MQTQSSKSLVSVVVLNYNGQDVIGQCLESLRRSTRALHEIVVVDNASHDQSVQIIERDFPEVVLLKNDLNLGAPKGRNVGLVRALAARPEYIYTLDNDLTVDPDAIGKISNLLDSNRDIGCAGSLIYYDEPRNLIFNAGNYVNWSQNLVRSRGMNQRDEGQLEELVDVDYVGSGAMLVRRSLYEKLGLFDEGFIGYGYEDSDLGLRIGAAGHRVVSYAHSKVWHRPFTAIGKYSYKKKYLESRNAIRFLRIHGTARAWLKFSFYAVGGLFYAAVREGLRGNIKGVVGKAQGLYDGLRRREDRAWALLNPPDNDAR